MIQYLNECCDCAAPGYPCQGDSCPRRHVPHLFCDHCGQEVNELFHVDGEQVCEDCAQEAEENASLSRGA